MVNKKQTQQYKQYILILDPNDKDDMELIDYIELKHDKKRKNSYSAILRSALKLKKDEE